jgi:hypothetical protein
VCVNKLIAIIELG